MKQLTDKQKKIIAIVVAILAVIHFGPRYLHMFIPTDAHADQGKTSAAHYAPIAPPTAPLPPPSPEAVAAGKYGGIWIGDELMLDQNRCKIQLEIRLSDDLPKKLKGYEQKSCVPLQPLAGGKLARGSIADVIRATSPVSAVMTGTAQDGCGVHPRLSYNHPAHAGPQLSRRQRLYSSAEQFGAAIRALCIYR